MFGNGSFLRRAKRFKIPKPKPEEAHIQHVNSYNHFTLYGPQSVSAAVAANYHHVAAAAAVHHRPAGPNPAAAGGYPAFDMMGGYAAGAGASPYGTPAHFQTGPGLGAPKQEPSACGAGWGGPSGAVATSCGGNGVPVTASHYGLPGPGPYYAFGGGSAPGGFPSPHANYLGMAGPAGGGQMAPPLPSAYSTFHQASPAYPTSTIVGNAAMSGGYGGPGAPMGGQLTGVSSAGSSHLR